MRPLKLVLDTNVIVSAHISPDGLQRSILLFALSDDAQLFVSPEILSEYAEVLLRPKFKLTHAQVAASLRLIQTKARLTTPRHSLSAAKDPDDNMFLECAEAVGADYLVTGNKRHFPEIWGKTRVVNARELINLIAPNLKR